MRPIRIHNALLGLIIAAAALFQPAAFAAWPDRPIRLVWPFATGGIGATLAHIMAEGLSTRLGQPVFVDSKPGGGGILGFQTVKIAPPDGYTIMLGTNSTSTITPSLYKALSFDPVKDFAHIGMSFIGNNLIVVRADSPIKTFADLRAQAKAKPDALTYGSAGNGTTFHLTPAMFDMLNGSKMVHVPYKGAGPAFVGLLGGEVSVVFGTTESLVQVQAGKLRGLAVMSRKRLSAAPDIPTTAEVGMPELVLESFYGLFAPAGTPKEIIERLNKEAAAVVNSPAVRKQLETLVMEPAPDTSSKYFVEQIIAETARWRPVIQASGITVE